MQNLVVKTLLLALLISAGNLLADPLRWQGLQSLQSKDLNAVIDHNSPTIVTFYQLDCPSCDRQLAELDCFHKQGWKTHAVGVGINRLEALRKLRSHSQQANAYRIDLSLARNHGLNASPISFLKVSEKDSGRWLLGLVACSAIDSSLLSNILN